MSLRFEGANTGKDEMSLEAGEYYVTDKHPDCVRLKLRDGKDVRIYADPEGDEPVRGKVCSSTDGAVRRVEIVDMVVRFVD